MPTIDLDQNVHELLSRHRQLDESWSDLIRRLRRTHRPSALDFAGMWNDKPQEEIDALRGETRRLFEAWDQSLRV